MIELMSRPLTWDNTTTLSRLVRKFVSFETSNDVKKDVREHGIDLHSCTWSSSFTIISISLTSFISSSETLTSGATCGRFWTWRDNERKMAGGMTLSPVLRGLFRKVHRSMYSGPRC